MYIIMKVITQALIQESITIMNYDDSFRNEVD